MSQGVTLKVKVVGGPHDGLIIDFPADEIPRHGGEAIGLLGGLAQWSDPRTNPIVVRWVDRPE